MKTVRLLCALVSCFAVMPAFADETKDARLDAVLNKLKFSYEVTASGNAKLVMGGFDGDRTQMVMINADTEILGEYESRKVWTVAYWSESPLPEDKVRKLLQENGQYKIGAWSLQTVNSKHCAVFTVQIPANANARVLNAAVKAAELSGDGIERELTGKDDF